MEIRLSDDDELEGIKRKKIKTLKTSCSSEEASKHIIIKNDDDTLKCFLERTCCKSSSSIISQSSAERLCGWVNVGRKREQLAWSLKSISDISSRRTIENWGLIKNWMKKYTQSLVSNFHSINFIDRSSGRMRLKRRHQQNFLKLFSESLWARFNAMYP